MKKILLCIMILVFFICAFAALPARAEEQDRTVFSLFKTINFDYPKFEGIAFYEWESGLLYKGIGVNIINMEFKLKYDYRVDFDYYYIQDINKDCIGISTSLDMPFKLLKEFVGLFGADFNIGIAEFLSYFRVGFYGRPTDAETFNFRKWTYGNSAVLLKIQF